VVLLADTTFSGSSGPFPITVSATHEPASLKSATQYSLAWDYICGAVLVCFVLLEGRQSGLNLKPEFRACLGDSTEQSRIPVFGRLISL